MACSDRDVFRLLPWFLPVLLTGAACASAEPVSAPAVAVDPPHTPAWEMAGTPPRAGRSDTELVQIERPEGCVGTDQPAIVDERVSRGILTPVWRCFAGCGPGLEYVSRVHFHRGRPVSHVECAPACGAGMHRVTYVVHVPSESDDTQGCAPGDPPDALAQSLAADQERQRKACIEARRHAVASVEEDVRRAERDASAIEGAEEHLHALEKMCDGRQQPGSYGSDSSSDAYTAERDRVLAIAAPDLAAEVPALASRLRLARAAAKKLAERAAAVEQQRAAGARRALAPCFAACDSTRAQCQTACTKDVRWGACGACDTSYADCWGACERPPRTWTTAH